VLGIQGGHLRHNGQPAFSCVHEIVGQNDRKGLITNDRLRTEHCVAETQWFRLANINAVNAIGCNTLHHPQELVLVLCRQLGFQFNRLVKVILNGALGSPGDKNHLGDSRCSSLLHRILNQWLVDHRQHLLRARLGGR